MMIFMGNLPQVRSEDQLCEILQLPPGQARRLRLFKKRTDTGDLLRYGLLYTESPDLLPKLRRRLERSASEAAQVTLREYVPRSIGNERRRLDWRAQRWPFPERRLAERRRH